MAFGTVTIGRLALREALVPAPEKADASGGSTLTLSGQEASPLSTVAVVEAIQADVRGLAGAFVPVTFTDKANLDGYYQVADVSAELMNWNDEVVTCAWSVGLERVGSDAEVDVEARLAGPLTRTNSFSATGERWHAPPIGHTAYWSSSTTPSTMTRTSADGAITVYRGVPVSTSPRYACPVEAFMAGRVRILDASRERVGTRWEVSPTGWQLDNALVRVTVSGGFLSVASWTSGAWAAKGWDVLVNAVSMGAPSGATVLRNDPECVILRLLWPLTVGRVTCDVVLRRGARLVELYVRTAASSTIKVVRTSTEAGTAGTGYVRATSNDANGNRYVIGSALTHTADTTIGGLSKTTTTTLDAAIGVELAGSSAVTGDTAATLYAQYLGSAAESVRGARR